MLSPAVDGLGTAMSVKVRNDDLPIEAKDIGAATKTS